MFEFRVMDNGPEPWGDVRFDAENEEAARVACERWLRDKHVEPHGTLQPDFKLEVIKP